MPYTRADVINTYRENFPQLKTLNDNDIWRVAAVNDPELAKGISELQTPAQPYQSPAYGPTGATATQTATDAAANILRGVPETVGALYDKVKGRLSGTAPEALPPRVMHGDTAIPRPAPPPGPLTTIAKGAMEIARPGSQDATVNPGSPEWTQAQHFAGQTLGGAAMDVGLDAAGAGAGKAWDAFKNRTSFTAPAAGKRLIQSWMPVNKSSLKYHADPVESVSQLPAAPTREKFLENVDYAATATDQELMSAIRRRNEVAAQEGLHNGKDVGPVLQGEIESIVAEAKPSMRDSLRSDLNDLVKELKERNKGTYLDAGQVLSEKRILGEKTNFSGSDTAGVSYEVGKQRLYSALDKTFDGMVPEAADLNKFSSGLLEGKKLLSEQIRKEGNLPVAHETLFGTLKSKLPETYIKTSINELIRGKAKLPVAGSGPLEFNTEAAPVNYLGTNPVPTSAGAPINNFSAKGAESPTSHLGTPGTKAGAPINNFGIVKAEVSNPLGLTRTNAGAPINDFSAKKPEIDVARDSHGLFMKVKNKGR